MAESDPTHDHAAAPEHSMHVQDPRNRAESTPQTPIRPESALKSALETDKQTLQCTGTKTPNTTDTAEPEQEPEPQTKQEHVQTPEREEAMSVLSSDASPHDSDFDFLQISTEAGFSLLSPSPQRRSFTGSETEFVAGPLASPPLSSSGSSAACSPSRFFKSPCVTSGNKTRTDRTGKTPQRRTIVPIRLATPKRLMEAIDELSQREDKEAVASAVGQDESEEKPAVVPTARAVRKASTSSTPPRTPSPSSRQELLARRLKDVFDRTDDDERQSVRGAVKSPALSTRKAYRVDTSSSLLDVDDIQCVPSGLLPSPSEHDSFFSFANSLSPLMPAEEFENSFMSVKLSPLVSLACYEMPRLLPPFPEQQGDQATSPSAGMFNGAPLILKTPKNKAKRSRGLPSAGSLAGGGISAPGSAFRLASPSLFSESFPNIQASTSATPGKDERSKLGGHSVMKMKLHTSLRASPSSLDSHPTREIQAINNSLKRKKYIRRRKADEHPQLTRRSSASNVQRKLLQTPVKTAASPRTRSPLHPWNGQSPRADVFKTPTPRKLAPTQQHAKAADDSPVAAPASPPVARRLLAATDPTPAPTTPVNARKRKASHCVSMPSQLANIAGLQMRKSPRGVRQAVALAVTPAKQIKREATTPGKYSVLTPQPGVSGVPAFDSSVLKTPTAIGSSTLLTMSLQSASKAPLGPAALAVPAQAPKKAPCNCKKSKCLKLYCECFASGGYCDESCNCLDCANTTATEDVRRLAIAARLEKNPNAFKPKIGARGARRLSVGASGGSFQSAGSFQSPPGQLSFQQQQQLLLVATKMHKHGCHCKKSACQKKYCECFQAGVPCGENCRCIDCKNQAPCVAHAGVATAGSVVSGTPSRIANELEETFVSPVLQGVHQRLRIDRETWKKNFSSPFEASPRHERERTERFQSRLLASTGGNVGGNSLRVRVRAVPFASPRTPQVATKAGSKRPRGLSPTRGDADEQRGSHVEPASSAKERELQFGFATKTSIGVGRAALSAVVRSSVAAERVFVLPLFGASLPPLESGVSASIFRFLTNADLHNASLVSHLWNQVALGDAVWDHANFIPTEASVADAKRRRLTTPITRQEMSRQVAIKHEPNLAVLSALR